MQPYHLAMESAVVIQGMGMAINDAITICTVVVILHKIMLYSLLQCISITDCCIRVSGCSSTK